jgi:RNA recognition motif-containing protein
MKKQLESNIFVQFVPKEVEEEEFKEQMSKAGKVVSVRLTPYNQTNKVTGEQFTNFKNGYVCYEDIKQAQKCI